MNIDIKKIGELNEAIYNDNLLFLVEDQDGKGKKLKGANFREELKSDLDNLDLGLKMDLLWTNSSLKTAYERQMISLDLSNYKMILMLLMYDTTTNFNINCFCKKNSVFYCTIANPTIKYRNFNVNDTSINISNCYHSSTTYASETIDNTFLIPYQIYGVK